jgi:hypothetical protein
MQLIFVIKGRTLAEAFPSGMRWVGHVARVGKRRNVYRVLVGNLTEIDHLEDICVHEKMILKSILKY